MFIKKNEQNCRVLYGVTSKGSGMALHLPKELYYNYVRTITMHV